MCAAFSKERRRQRRRSSRRLTRSHACGSLRSCRESPASIRDATHDAPLEYRDAEAANVRFHVAIAAAGRNELALELIERCLAQIDRFRSLGVNFGAFQEGATEAHLAIVDAIARHDPDAARVRMEEHLDCGSRLMKDALLRGQLSTIGID
jgi:DNA-binding GntR family transcriptional regulator